MNTTVDLCQNKQSRLLASDLMVDRLRLVVIAHLGSQALTGLPLATTHLMQQWLGRQISALEIARIP